MFSTVVNFCYLKDLCSCCQLPLNSRSGSVCLVGKIKCLVRGLTALILYIWPILRVVISIVTNEPYYIKYAIQLAMFYFPALAVLCWRNNNSSSNNSSSNNSNSRPQQAHKRKTLTVLNIIINNNNINIKRDKPTRWRTEEAPPTRTAPPQRWTTNTRLPPGTTNSWLLPRQRQATINSSSNSWHRQLHVASRDQYYKTFFVSFDDLIKLWEDFDVAIT